ncbi:hypothetical protein LOZ66_004992 [Ophidiomyces ophidiicola]|nr:hypothetical protein LOZ66_004992 [Ophidiomyces ophidiicola]
MADNESWIGRLTCRVTSLLCDVLPSVGDYLSVNRVQEIGLKTPKDTNQEGIPPALLPKVYRFPTPPSFPSAGGMPSWFVSLGVFSPISWTRFTERQSPTPGSTSQSKDVTLQVSRPIQNSFRLTTVVRPALSKFLLHVVVLLMALEYEVVRSLANYENAISWTEEAWQHQIRRSRRLSEDDYLGLTGVLPLDQAKQGMKLLKEAGMRKLNFAGGELFLYPKFMQELLRYRESTVAHAPAL